MTIPAPGGPGLSGKAHQGLFSVDTEEGEGRKSSFPTPRHVGGGSGNPCPRDPQWHKAMWQRLKLRPLLVVFHFHSSVPQDPAVPRLQDQREMFSVAGRGF